MNILGYAEKKTVGFDISPFNRVDAVILCWLSYFNYPDYLKGGEGVALKDLFSRGLLPDKQMYSAAFSPRKSKKFFRFLAENPRYGDLVLCDFCDERDDAREKQFAAVCIKIKENEYFASFRGTDPSFTGWKEDFNLACCYPVPSQQRAYEYLESEMKKFPDGKFYSGGHSKGGNIAAYAAVNADKRLQDRLINVFNFDGPGFMNDVYDEEGYARIADKIVKIVPQSSFVGMLLETRDCYLIVKSRNLSVLQHDPFSWNIKDDDFCYLKDRSKFSVRLERAINNWLDEIPVHERVRLVKMIYGALTALGMRDINEFNRTLYKQIPMLYLRYKNLDQGDRDFFDEKISRLKQLFDSQS